MNRVVKTFTIPVAVTVIADTTSDEEGSKVCRIAAEKYLSSVLPKDPVPLKQESNSMVVETEHGIWDMCFQTEFTMDIDTFVSVCKECGLRVEVKSTLELVGAESAFAYLDSDILRDKSDSLCSWSNEWNGVNCLDRVMVDYYDALWKQSDGSYIVNATDLGDCPRFVRSIEELRTICTNAIKAIHKLETDSSYRPRCIDLNHPDADIEE